VRWFGNNPVRDAIVLLTAVACFGIWRDEFPDPRILAGAGALGLLAMMTLVFGLRDHLRSGAGAPVWSSLLAVAAGSAGFYYHLFLPTDWTPLLHPGWAMRYSQGFNAALIASGVVNLLLEASAWRWHAGYSACVVGDSAKDTQIAELKSHITELEDMVREPGARRAILKARHVDSHPRASEMEKAQLTMKFQRASSLLERLGID
jgi:hypothetical protein